MTYIRVHGQNVDWPKNVISEEALRAYADATDAHDVIQYHMGHPRPRVVRAVADLRDGLAFLRVPKGSVK